ncbi:hypothetical protein [Streptomyces sp. NPDC060022]|uniref:hypothetical protein n=1 Tax=Streptomyces sp. NPDC060022 TaxID=3347039 RepID=UPI0036C86258
MLKHALRRLRFVKSQKPSDADSAEFAAWRDRIAGALDALSCALVFEEDQISARAEAAFDAELGRGLSRK